MRSNFGENLHARRVLGLGRVNYEKMKNKLSCESFFFVVLRIVKEINILYEVAVCR